MSRIQATRWIIPIIAAFGLAWAGSGWAQNPGAGQKVGEKVDEVIKDIKGGLKKAGNVTKEQFARAKTAVNNMGVESRVYGRIHWDKALNEASIDLTTTEDGVITLNGTVADAKARTRAVDLARETVGVTRVVDQLAIRPAATTAP
jgi:hyperosmotically inducible protein